MLINREETLSGKKAWTLEQDLMLLELVKKGMTANQISNAFSQIGVRHYLHSVRYRMQWLSDLGKEEWSEKDLAAWHSQRDISANAPWRKVVEDVVAKVLARREQAKR